MRALARVPRTSAREGTAHAHARVPAQVPARVSAQPWVVSGIGVGLWAPPHNSHLCGAPQSPGLPGAAQLWVVWRASDRPSCAQLQLLVVRRCARRTAEVRPAISGTNRRTDPLVGSIDHVDPVPTGTIPCDGQGRAMDGAARWPPCGLGLGL